MESQNEARSKSKARLALRVGIISAFVFAISWSLPSVFNWVFFSTAAYSFFLAWYYLPRAPKSISTEQGEGSTPGTRSTADKAKRFMFIAILSVIGTFFLLLLIGILASDDEASTINTTEPGLQEAVSKNVEDIVGLTELANEFFSLQQYDSANYYYDIVLSGDPQNTAALYNKGLIFYNQERYNEAFPFFTKAYDLGMRDAFLSHVLGYLHDNEGNTSKAIGFYKEALQQDSSRTDIYARLAELDPANANRYKELEIRWKN